MMALALADDPVTVTTIPARGNVNVGEVLTLTLTITVKGVNVANINLPNVDGLTLNGTGTNPQADHEDFNFFLTPSRAGDFVIPAFDIKTVDGQTLHVNQIKIHAQRYPDDQ
ncbi:MAG: BatD family protein [Chthoniobacteraceae bacterium]